VRRIVTENYDRARKIVLENLDKLKLLADALLEFETVDGAEIDTIFAGGQLARTPSTWISAGARLPPDKRPLPAERPSRPGIFSPPRPMPDPEKA